MEFSHLFIFQLRSLPSGLKPSAQLMTRTAIVRHQNRLVDAVQPLPEDAFIGRRNLISLRPSLRCPAYQNLIGARFCAASYREQFVIMRGILEGEALRYETIAFSN